MSGSPWIGLVAVVVLLATVFWAVGVLGEAVPGELARKTLHVGAGLSTLLFPWIFHDRWPVVLLCVVATLALLALRGLPALDRWGRAYRCIARASLGEFYFALGVAFVFSMSSANTVLFAIPILLLTFADAAAALVGTRYGRRRWPFSATKSLEGSAAFFAVGTLASFSGLWLLSSAAPLECLAIALAVAGVATLCEAAAGSGLDNLTVPIGAYALLAVIAPESLQAHTRSATSLALVAGMSLFIVLLAAFMLGRVCSNARVTAPTPGRHVAVR